MACTCPHCAALLIYSAFQIGQPATCPSCGGAFPLPAEDMPLETFCRHVERLRTVQGPSSESPVQVAEREAAAPSTIYEPPNAKGTVHLP